MRPHVEDLVLRSWESLRLPLRATMLFQRASLCLPLVSPVSPSGPRRRQQQEALLVPPGEAAGQTAQSSRENPEDTASGSHFAVRQKPGASILSEKSKQHSKEICCVQDEDCFHQEMGFSK